MAHPQYRESRNNGLLMAILAIIIVAAIAFGLWWMVAERPIATQTGADRVETPSVPADGGGTQPVPPTPSPAGP